MLLGRGKSYRKNLAEAAKTDSVAIDVETVCNPFRILHLVYTTHEGKLCPLTCLEINSMEQNTQIYTYTYNHKTITYVTFLYLCICGRVHTQHEYYLSHSIK